MRLESVFGEVLRERRKAAGLSQEALALEAGVERNFISLVELGRNSLSVRVLFKLCRVLDVTPSQLLQQVETRMPGAAKRRAARR